MRSETGASSHTGGGGAVVLHVRSRRTHATSTSSPLSMQLSKDGASASMGVAIGRDTCLHDPLVSVAHGTLECTPQHGVWVFVDHSETGTLLNQKHRVHGDAVVVRDGDVLSLGHTEITLAFQGARRKPVNEDDLNNNQRTHALVSPPPAPSARPMSHNLARHILPNIYTGRGPVQPPPEHINSPVPSAYLKQKRHSISVDTRKPVTLGVAPALATSALSTSQTFARSQHKPLVPSAPTTPPLKDSPVRPSVAHHVPAAIHSPQSSYYRVKFKDDEPQTMGSPTIREEDERPKHQRDVDNNAEFTPLVPSPPLEYSSSPVPQTSFPHRMHHALAGAGAAAKSAKPSALPGMAGSPLYTYDSPPAKAASQRPMELRVQIARRNAELAAGGPRAALAAAAATSTPTAGNTRPVLSRGTTLPGSTVVGPSPYKQPHNQQRRYSGVAMDFAAPASPMASRVLDQERSFTNIIHAKRKQEEKLKQEQQEWMRNQFPGVPSMSPIRHNDGSNTRGKDRSSSGSSQNDEDDAGGGITIPAKAPALLRTVSLGVVNAHQIQSPRVKQAAMASHARKGGFSSKMQSSRSSQDDSALAQILLRRQRSSGEESVASSVSTEPSNHRRVTRSLSLSGSYVASSGELSDFLGYDDDDANDGLLSFTSYFDKDEASATLSPRQQQQLLAQTTHPAPAQPHRLIYPHISHLRSRAPSLDDDMAGVLNSPSSHARPGGGFGFGASPEPRSVAKPRVRSADSKHKSLFGRGQQP